VLRYWEQEFSQLNPVKRRGNRRYYQRHEVELIRQIRALLSLEGFTISGARNKLESDGSEAEDSVEPDKVNVSSEMIGGLINELEELAVMLRD
jgi:DNA-binding transcriptional MerR regulator